MCAVVKNFDLVLFISVLGGGGAPIRCKKNLDYVFGRVSQVITIPRDLIKS